ncbi:hypothetical protein GGE45_006326 [Rhizobium aethiopicum]|uniref:Uncharacterized protein n=1 Tax=Rhizobium aethiopicum TaxID=1138170 RepID=A0A7W6VSB7_9HYPH|nr:hypothetical protein [Rhizobium aethiopicum]MBB4583944.1 hypothetical protein [Rhizobium aethiopicum]
MSELVAAAAGRRPEFIVAPAGTTVNSGREIEELLSDEVFHVGFLMDPAIDHDGAEHHPA